MVVCDGESNGRGFHFFLSSILKKIFYLVVQNQYERTAGTAENVGERALEEGIATFRLVNGGPTVKSILVEDVTLGSARLHHHASSHRVEGIGHNTRDGGYGLFGKLRQVKKL